MSQWRLTLPPLPPRDRRALIRGAGIVVGLLVLGKGIPAWRSWVVQAEAAASELAESADQAAGLSRALPALRDSLRVRSTQLNAVSATVVPGASPGSSAATLASLLGVAATDAGVKLGGLEPRADTGEPTLGATRARGAHSSFVHVSVHGEMTGDIVAITQFLASLEHGPAMLQVRSLSLTQADPAAPTTRMEILHGDLTVVGLARRAVSVPDTRRVKQVLGEIVATRLLPPAALGGSAASATRQSVDAP